LRSGGGVAAAVQPAEVKRAPAVTAARPGTDAVVSAPRWGVTDTEAEQLDERQQAHLAALVAAFNAKTAGSKRIAIENRAALADVRSTAGFKRFIKEMLYPIVVERGENAHVVDVDGNDYIDVTMGFGVHLFGHKPPFLHAALADQLERDAPLGPENRDSGEAARLVKELTGCERVSFFNTGTEAVMTAIRLVRARSKRNRIALFKGSYHGHADPTLGIGLGDGQVVPLSGGIPADTLNHLLILDYGSEDALRIIAEHAHELAAVLVEPVQSRHPDRQPGEFLRELRRVTAANDIALVFDEMITGFRIAAGGAQAWFGVEADVVTYGKVVGGGMPIGVIAGKAAWLDYLDGGDWRYGDDSAPRNETIFYAGTFNKNPWTMAAARATLTEIRRLGPSAYTELNRRTTRLAAMLNAFFESENLPMEVVHFASLFRFKARGKIDLFFFHMLMQGIYVWEGRNCFLSHAHTEEDVARIVAAVKESVLAMRDGGFIEAIGAPVRKSAPVTKAQSQLLMLGEIADDGLLAYNIHLTTSLSGRVDCAALELALNALVRRHEALRMVFPQGSGRQEILLPQWMPLGRMDLSDYAEADREDAYDAWFAQENRHRFDLATGPLLRVTLIALAGDEHRLIMTLPHIIGDGITLNILIEDLIAFYNAERDGRAVALAPATPFREYVAWLEAESAGPDFSAHAAWWREQLSGPLPVLGLPADHPRPAVKSFEAAVASITLEASLAEKLRRFSRGRSATLFMTCLAAWQLLLHRLSGDGDVIVGVPTMGRAMEGADTLVGYCTHLLPIRSRLDDEATFAAFLAQTRKSLLDAFEHQDYPFAALLETLDLPHDPSRPPLLSATFNMDQPGQLPALGEAQVVLIPPPVRYASYEMAMNVTDLAGALIVECKYHTSLFARERIAILLRQYEALLGEIVEDAERGVVDYDLACVSGAVALPDPAAPLPQPDYELPVTLLLRHAEETPDAVAIVDPARRWTYAELARDATTLACVLAARGVGPGDRLAVEGPRDGRLVCALIATWLAGAAFITLDDQLPAARRRVIVEIGGAKLLVNLAATASESAPDGIDVLDLAPDAPWPEQENPGIPLPPLSPAIPPTSSSPRARRGYRRASSGCTRASPISSPGSASASKSVRRIGWRS
jgi:glutamate-1-semialdehyde aminotransferase